MTAYTPGPWAFEGGEWITGPNKERIAQVYNWVAGYLDNGHLIASAPNLLEACKEAYRFFLVLNEIAQPEGMPEMVRIIEQAIRKATE